MNVIRRFVVEIFNCSRFYQTTKISTLNDYFSILILFFFQIKLMSEEIDDLSLTYQEYKNSNVEEVAFLRNKVVSNEQNRREQKRTEQNRTDQR